jgi:glycosyltransferase involved in cell wall biosynthesis
VEFLTELLDSVFLQTYTEFEVLISDHSQNDDIENYLSTSWAKENVHYYRNANGRGSIAANFNNLIDKATGTHIKFLLQDDYFYDANSLQIEVDNLGAADWGLCATIHRYGDSFSWHLIPEYTPNIYLGANTIGSPSLLLCKREACQYFDGNLTLLVDCDFYRTMYDKYGLPKTTDAITTVSRMWEGQSQRAINEQLKASEVKYVMEKYALKV